MTIVSIGELALSMSPLISATILACWARWKGATLVLTFKDFGNFSLAVRPKSKRPQKRFQRPSP